MMAPNTAEKLKERKYNSIKASHENKGKRKKKSRAVVHHQATSPATDTS